MKYYLIDGDSIIYAGKVVQNKTTKHVTANLTKFYKKNAHKEWEENELSNDLHINGRIATKFYRGQVVEYSSLELAKKQADKRK